MTASFKQIRIDKDISEKEGFATIVLSAILIFSIGILLLMQFNLNPFIVGLIMLLSAFIGRPLMRKFYSDNTSEKDIIGTLSFSADKISSKSDSTNFTIDIDNIKAFNLCYNYIKGRQFTDKDIIHNGLAKLNLIDNTNNEQQIKFLIEKQEQLESLKEIIKEYYKQGIRVTEKMGKYQVKTILFQADLSFDKLQKLKQELNVESFY